MWEYWARIFIHQFLNIFIIRHQNCYQGYVKFIFKIEIITMNLKNNKYYKKDVLYKHTFIIIIQLG